MVIHNKRTMEQPSIASFIKNEILSSKANINELKNIAQQQEKQLSTTNEIIKLKQYSLRELEKNNTYLQDSVATTITNELSTPPKVPPPIKIKFPNPKPENTQHNVNLQLCLSPSLTTNFEDTQLSQKSPSTPITPITATPKSPSLLSQLLHCSPDSPKPITRKSKKRKSSVSS